MTSEGTCHLNLKLLDSGHFLSLDPVLGSRPQRDASPEYSLRHDRYCWNNGQWLYHPYLVKVYHTLKKQNKTNLNPDLDFPRCEVQVII